MAAFPGVLVRPRAECNPAFNTSQGGGGHETLVSPPWDVVRSGFHSARGRTRTVERPTRGPRRISDHGNHRFRNDAEVQRRFLLAERSRRLAAGFVSASRASISPAGLG